MLQFNPIDAFLYLTDKSLQLYFKNINYSIVLEFAPEIVANQEVRDKVKYEEMLRRFLIDNEISDKHVAILLSKNLLFQKELAEEQIKDVDVEAKKFLSEIPFALEEITEIEYKRESGMSLIATNKDLYEIIFRVVNEHKGRVNFIVPITYLFNENIIEITPDQAKQIFGSEDQMSKADFLTKTKLNAETNVAQAETSVAETPQKVEEVKASSPIPGLADKFKANVKIIVIILMVILLIGLIGFIILNFNITPK